MQPVRRIKQWFFKRALHKALQKEAVTPDQLHSYNPGKKILLLYDCSRQENRHVVQRFAEDIRNQGKSVIVFCYNHSKTGDVQSIPHRVIGKKDLNWYGRPKADSLDAFGDKSFDLLINFDQENGDALAYTAAFVRAAFKVAFTFSPHPEIYDLMVDRPPAASLDRLIRDVREILNTVSGSPEPLGFL